MPDTCLPIVHPWPLAHSPLDWHVAGFAPAFIRPARAEVLGALFNAVLIIVVVVAIVASAIARLGDPSFHFAAHLRHDYWSAALD